MDSTLSVSRTSDVKTTSVEPTSDVKTMSVEPTGNPVTDLQQVRSDPKSRSCSLKLPDFLVNVLLPAVPPGNLESKSCGMPVRFFYLLRYVGFLIFTQVTGWYAFYQYQNLQAECSPHFFLKFDYLWLVSVLIIVIYNLYGPLLRAISDLFCVYPGTYYFYKLQLNDTLHPNRERTINIYVTIFTTAFQVRTL
jgi:hypothetical protein